MNVLSMGERVLVISALVDGMSLRATERLTETSRPAIASLLVNVGTGCSRLHDAMMRELHCDVLELDELWSYVFKKEGHLTPDDPAEYGDAYTWVAIDSRTKLVPSYLVSKRDASAAHLFARDLRGRILGRPQITTDGHRPYVDAIESAFGAKVDYAQILKTYRADESGGASRDDVRYSRGRVTRSVKRVVIGNPAPELISTSYVERSNLTTRMSVRRATRLTNGFSKRVEMLRHAIALHWSFYNLCRVHMTIRVTPAMEAGVTDHVWSITELIDAALKAPVPPPLPPPPPLRGHLRAPPGRPPATDVLPGQLSLPGVL